MAINLYSKDSVDNLLSAKLSISSLTNAAATTLNATAPTTGQVLSFDGTELKWATGGGGGGAAWGGITGTLSDQTDLQSALDAKYDASNPSSFIDASALSGYATESWVSSQGYITSAPPPSADFMMANAIASLIYSQSSNSYGDLSLGNVPKFITDLGTSWGIVDGSSTYYDCTGFSGASYSLSGTAGSGPYTVRVNGTDSAITIL